MNYKKDFVDGWELVRVGFMLIFRGVLGLIGAAGCGILEAWFTARGHIVALESSLKAFGASIGQSLAHTGGRVLEAMRGFCGAVAFIAVTMACAAGWILAHTGRGIVAAVGFCGCVLIRAWGLAQAMGDVALGILWGIRKWVHESWEFRQAIILEM